MFRFLLDAHIDINTIAEKLIE